MTRNLRVLAIVSLLQDTSSELLYPILPIFLTSVLGAPVAVVGITEGVADGLAALTKIASGWVADRTRRRPMVGAGYALAAIGKLLIAMATAWPIVLLARSIDRFGKGIRGAPRDALLADGIPKEFLGRVYGFHRSMDTLGAVIGPLMGLALFHAFDEQYRPVFVIAVIPAAVSAVAVLWVRESPVRQVAAPADAATARSGDGSGRVHTHAPLPTAYWRAFALLTAFALVNFSDALLILRARHLGLSITQLIVAYALYNVVYSALSYPAGAIADRIPKRLVIGSGFIVFGITYAGLGLVGSAVWVWPLFVLYGSYTALTDGVSKAWVVSTVPAESRGRALGLQAGAAGFGAIAAGTWAGLFWHDTGRGPLLVSGVAAVILGAVTLAVRSRPAH